MPEAHPDPWAQAAIEQNRHWLLAYLLGATGDRHVAEDLVQEVFRIAFEKRENYRTDLPFGAWLRGIAQNCVAQYYRERKREPLLAGDALSHYQGVFESGEARALDPALAESRLAALRQCLQVLTERARRILDERYVQGLSAAVVGARAGMSEAAVNAATYRSRGVLAECVERKRAAP